MDVLDELGLALVHALQLDARASFTELADILGVSDQTVARRYAQLLRRDILTISAHRRPDASRTQWLVWSTCTPAAASAIAAALAARRDTQWVMIASGGADVICLVETGNRDEVPLGGLRRTPGLVSLRARTVLHCFVGGPVAWPGRMIGLTAQQQARLTPPRPTSALSWHRPDEVDERIMTALARDPRIGYGALARVAAVSEVTARRRVSRLRADGRLYFDVHVDPSALGGGHLSVLSANVPTRTLPDVGAALARHTEIAYAAAVTGTDNLIAIAATASPAGLYDYLTGRLATVDGAHLTETIPVHHIVKGATTSGHAALP